ncbi:Putative LMBR1-like membrane protein [Septoria linicola]|uniref:LMBR1-like membrane protein n=1 Tax=Septoria linicola TaxID=215465 RepID=A0A9Q9AJ65_9PEZI|nr:putative LMBR1-like membrane protein [Septoria linicola]USW47067.1 Putative LMBR1-like membrane protein [Septoria linicola]
MEDAAAEAATSSVGSNIFTFTALIVIALLVLLAIRHYLPLRNTPQWLLVPVFLALFLPSSIILLVPIDCAESNASKAIWLPERATLVAWRIAYWLTFVLTWFILPLLGEYCDSGYRDTRQRMIDSARSNLRYQMIVLSTGILGLVYFIFENGFHVASIKGLLMALAYTWGLILAIGLMGHGLVAIPRRLFRNANVSSRLRWLHAQAPKIKDKLDDATEKLEQLEHTVLQLRRLKSGASSEQREWIDELATVPDGRPGTTAAIQATSTGIPAVVTDRYLADLTRKVKRARHRKARFVDEWDQLVQRASETQTILDSAASRQLVFARSGALSSFNVLTPAMRYYLHANVIPAVRIALSGVLAIASVLIVWSEIIKAFAPQLSIIGLTVVHRPNSTTGSKVNIGGQAVAALWLLYMDAAALYAIQDVRVWGNRALVKRQTYAESACWYSMQIAKLTVPLSYNFVTMLPPKVFENTMFFQFLGKLLDITPLGQNFSRFFPCFLLLPVLATLFNFYGKTKNILGFGVLEDESEDNPSGLGTGGWREGKALIDRELQSRGADSMLGLSSRGTSLDLERGANNNTSVNASSSASAGRSLGAVREDGNRQPAFRDSGVQEANRQFNSITNQEEEEDDSARHFYQDLGERLQNTFSTTETPDFVRKIGSAFKTPRWMQDDESGGSALSKWFGGRPEDGRLRL